MKLEEIPTDILAYLPDHLLSIHDFYSLFSTCRVFYEQYGSPHAYPYALPPVLPSHLLQPSPQLLIAGTARQIGDWAGRSKENDDDLYECMSSGNEGLMELVGRVARLTLSQIRELHKQWKTVLSRLARIMSEECRSPKSLGPDYIDQDQCAQIILNQWIYDELFHAYADEVQGNLHSYTATLEIRTRCRWVARCTPGDFNRRSHLFREDGSFSSLKEATWIAHSQVLAYRNTVVAVYFYRGVLQTENTVDIMYEGPWCSSSLDDMRKSLCFVVATSMGLESMLWLLPGYMSEHQAEIENRLQLVRDKIARIDDEDIRSWYTAFKSLETPEGSRCNGWMGWAGLWRDQVDGMDTGTWSVEQFQQDEERMDYMRFHPTTEVSVN